MSDRFYNVIVEGTRFDQFIAVAKSSVAVADLHAVESAMLLHGTRLDLWALSSCGEGYTIVECGGLSPISVKLGD